MFSRVPNDPGPVLDEFGNGSGLGNLVAKSRRLWAGSRKGIERDAAGIGDGRIKVSERGFWIGFDYCGRKTGQTGADFVTRPNTKTCDIWNG